MPRREGSCRAGSRSSRSTPRRRSWSGTSGIMGGNGSRRASQTRCASTIFRATRAGRLFRTASTTWPATRPGSAWDAITTRPPSQLPRFVSGGPRWAGAPTPRRPRCSSRPTRAAATATARARGSVNSRRSPMRPNSASASVTSPRARASGTKSSIGSSATSPRTGAGHPLRRSRPSWTSSATHGDDRGPAGHGEA